MSNKSVVVNFMFELVIVEMIVVAVVVETNLCDTLEDGFRTERLVALEVCEVVR